MSDRFLRASFFANGDVGRLAQVRVCGVGMIYSGGSGALGELRCAECEVESASLAIWAGGAMLCAHCLARAGFEIEGDYFWDIVDGMNSRRRSERRDADLYRKAKVPDRLRRQVVERDGFRCRYCAVTVNRPNLDHVLPESKGGKTDLQNLVVSCKGCNSKKGTRAPDEAGMTLLPIGTAEG